MQSPDVFVFVLKTMSMSGFEITSFLEELSRNLIHIDKYRYIDLT